jgi:hypothetical protein
MLAIQCPSCQHKNTPGERFCEFCGVPLDLKPCPNCGKVDLVTTQVCSACGEVFPHIALAPNGEASETYRPAGNVAGETPASSRRGRPTYSNTIQAPPSSTEAPPSRALPLILVAIVAGGIPLLWMNRDRMPLPKAWHVQSTPPESASPLPAPAPVQAPAATPQPVPAKNDPPKEEPEKERAAKQEPTEQKAPTKQQSAPAQAPSAARQRESARTAGGTQAGTPPRECTEAVAALGLCERKPKRD